MIKFLLGLSALSFLFVFYLNSQSGNSSETNPYSRIQTSNKQNNLGSKKSIKNRTAKKLFKSWKKIKSQKLAASVYKNKDVRTKKSNSIQRRRDSFNARDSNQALEDIKDLSNQNVNIENEEMVYENLSIYLKRLDKPLSVNEMFYVIRIIGQLVEHDPSNAPEELLYFQLKNLDQSEKELSFNKAGLTALQVRRLQERLLNYENILENGNG